MVALEGLKPPLECWGCRGALAGGVEGPTSWMVPGMLGQSLSEARAPMGSHSHKGTRGRQIPPDPSRRRSHSSVTNLFFLK